MDDNGLPPEQRPLPPSEGAPSSSPSLPRSQPPGPSAHVHRAPPSRRANQRPGVGFGIVLILLGLLFLVGQFAPGLWSWVGGFGWPLIVIAVGLGLVLIGLLVGVPGLAVPGCVVGGIGLLLNWQNNTGHWESWAYAWALIPGFVGLGTLIMGLYDRRRDQLSGGLWLIVISAILYGVFASFLGGANLFGRYWPVLIIALGVVLLLGSLFRFRRVE
jgi:hypothetical protein